MKTTIENLIDLGVLIINDQQTDFEAYNVNDQYVVHTDNHESETLILTEVILIDDGECYWEAYLSGNEEKGAIELMINEEFECTLLHNVEVDLTNNVQQEIDSMFKRISARYSSIGDVNNCLAAALENGDNVLASACHKLLATM